MAADSTREAELEDGFIELDVALVDAIIAGPSALSDFMSRLTKLHDIALHAMSSNLLSARTKDLIGVVAASGSIIVQNVQRLHSFTSTSHKQQQTEICEVFRRLSLDEDSAPKEFGITSSKEGRVSQQHGSALVEPNMLASRANKLPAASKPSSFRPFWAHTSALYGWINDNIHCPYPPPRTRSSFAKQCGVTVKAIDEWFTNARRRIGWTAIAKNHFRGKRSLIVDYAYRVFVQMDTQTLTDTSLIEEFMKMRRTVQRIYKEKCEESQLSNQVGIISQNAVHIDARDWDIKSSNSTEDHCSSHTSPTLSSTSLRADERPSDKADSECRGHLKRKLSELSVKSSATKRRVDELSASRDVSVRVPKLTTSTSVKATQQITTPCRKRPRPSSGSEGASPSKRRRADGECNAEEQSAKSGSWADFTQHTTPTQPLPSPTLLSQPQSSQIASIDAISIPPLDFNSLGSISFDNSELHDNFIVDEFTWAQWDADGSALQQSQSAACGDYLDGFMFPPEAGPSGQAVIDILPTFYNCPTWFDPCVDLLSEASPNQLLSHSLAMGGVDCSAMGDSQAFPLDYPGGVWTGTGQDWAKLCQWPDDSNRLSASDPVTVSL